MRIFNEVWSNIHNKYFDNEAYIYHYTSIEKAIRIIYNDSLRFAKLRLTNDTLEWKPKIPENKILNGDELSKAIKYFQDFGSIFLQVLCFSTDTELCPEERNQTCFINDYTGRGFSLPRMWAQYADNNSGLCIIFNKKKLSFLIDSHLQACLIHQGKVKYISQFDNDDIINEKTLESLKSYINHQHPGMKIAEKSIKDNDFLRKNSDFTEYNYFSKLDDWKNENEYRFLAFGEDNIFVPEINDAIEGVVIGENTELHDIEIIKNLCKDLCEIKSITFTYKGSKIQSV